MNELKGCPFCGCDLKIEYPMVMVVEKARINPDTHFIKCPRCGACGGTGWNKYEAITNWNKRHEGVK